VEAASLAANTYLPFEATFAIAAVAYSATGIAGWSATLGKAAAGLRVCAPTGGRIGLARALLRESAGKLCSAIPFFAGFFAAAGDSKQAWHDRIAGTIVVAVPRRRLTRMAAWALLGASFLAPGIGVARLVQLGLEVQPVLSSRGAAPSVEKASGAVEGAIEVSGLEEARQRECAGWLEEHGRPPALFLLEACRSFPVVVVGEKHWERESLEFLRDMLPELHQSGVRCLAMEWLLAKDDDLLDRLVTSETYDEELALEIARHHSWRTWGWKGYVDVLESVWRVNATRDRREAKLRVVGLDLPIDLPSVALAGFGDQAMIGPWWERLRALRMVGEIPKALLREAFMARQVERKALEAGDRAVVWVGAAHSTVRCKGPGSTAGPGRMAYLLARRHPDSVTQIVLHDAFGPGPGSSPAGNGVSALVESLMEPRGNAPLGWNVTGSPFAALRDSGHWSFQSEKTLGDLACSYLFLAPRARLNRCDWIAGYVTDSMLAENQPFYTAIGASTGIEVRDAPSASLALSRQ
jgi:hypothetical protein